MWMSELDRQMEKWSHEECTHEYKAWSPIEPLSCFWEGNLRKGTAEFWVKNLEGASVQISSQPPSAPCCPFLTFLRRDCRTPEQVCCKNQQRFTVSQAYALYWGKAWNPANLSAQDNNYQSSSKTSQNVQVYKTMTFSCLQHRWSSAESSASLALLRTINIPECHPILEITALVLLVGIFARCPFYEIDPYTFTKQVQITFWWAFGIAHFWSHYRNVLKGSPIGVDALVLSWSHSKYRRDLGMSSASPIFYSIALDCA